jgi:hypothetical protein
MGPRVTISQFFADIGAPLTNPRWSWGARRERDGAVFLRVWQDLKFVRDGATWVLVHEPWMNDKRILGHEERARHVAAVSAGAPCYLVMCVADDIEAKQRKIREFNEEQVFTGGELLDALPGFAYPPTIAPHVRRLTAAGATWIRLGARLNASDVR